MPQLKSCTQDSLLEELDEYNIEVIYRQLAVNSVAYMLMSRCGVDTEAVFEREDFAEIINFNTPATINALGIATSDISEMALRKSLRLSEMCNLRRKTKIAPLRRNLKHAMM